MWPLQETCAQDFTSLPLTSTFTFIQLIQEVSFQLQNGSRHCLDILSKIILPSSTLHYFLHYQLHHHLAQTSQHHHKLAYCNITTSTIRSTAAAPQPVTDNSNIPLHHQLRKNHCAIKRKQSRPKLPSLDFLCQSDTEASDGSFTAAYPPPSSICSYSTDILQDL